jgi:hypothetical protein
MKLLFKTILALMLILSQEAICQTADDEARFKKFWQEFARAVQVGDTAAFKMMSLSKFYCSFCPYNTEAERNALENAKIYIEPTEIFTIEKFIRSEFKVVFDSNTNRRISDNSKVYFDIRNFTSDELKEEHFQPLTLKNKFINYAVFVTVVDSSEKFEGVQLLLEFIETQNGYKLHALSGVP